MENYNCVIEESNLIPAITQGARVCPLYLLNIHP